MTELSRQKRIQIVIDDYDGIISEFEAFFIHSLIYAAESSVDAFSRYQIELDSRDSTRTFSALQQALTFAAAVSKFFWPPSGEKLHQARATKLRSAFCLAEDSALKCRQLRNMLEHFDERLDNFLLEDLAGAHFPAPIIGSSIVSQNNIPSYIYKLVHPDLKTCIMLNEKFSFGGIESEVLNVLKLARQFDDQGSTLPRI